MIYFEDLEIILSDDKGLIIKQGNIEHYNWYNYWGNSSSIPNKWKKNTQSPYLDLKQLFRYSIDPDVESYYIELYSFKEYYYWRIYYPSNDGRHLVYNLTKVLSKIDSVVNILEAGELLEDILE